MRILIRKTSWFTRCGSVYQNRSILFGSEYVRPIEQFHRESNITHWPTGSMQNIGFLLDPRSQTDKWHHKNGIQSIADPSSQTDKWDFGKHTNDTQSIADPIWQLDKWDFCHISGKIWPMVRQFDKWSSGKLPHIGQIDKHPNYMFGPLMTELWLVYLVW